MMLTMLLKNIKNQITLVNAKIKLFFDNLMNQSSVGIENRRVSITPTIQHGIFRLWIVLILLIVGMAVQAGTITSNAVTGNWSTGSTWVGGTAPGSGDDVVIVPGATITVTASTTCNSITFNAATSARTLTINSGVILTVTNGVTLNSLAAVNTMATLAGAGTLNCASITVGSNVTPTKNISTKLTSTLSNCSVSGNLTINSYKSGNKTNSGTYTQTSGTITVNGTISLPNTSGTAAFVLGASSPILYLNGATPFTTSGAGTKTVTLNGAGSTVYYNYAGAQTVYGGGYNNLTLQNSGVKTLMANLTITGNLNIGAGTTLDLATFTANRAAAGGTLTVAGTMKLGATTGGQTGSNFPLNYTTMTMTGGTVNYTGASQTVYPVSTNYNNLTLSGSGGKTFPTGTTTVNGILSIENGTNANTFTGSLSYGTNATLQYNAGSSARAVSSEWPASITTTCRGGVIIAGTGIITTNGAKTLDCGVPLTINSGSKLTLGNTLSVGGNFTNAGTFSTSASNYALTLGGDLSNTATLTLGSSAITIGAGCSNVNQSISGFTTTGAVTMSKTGGTATFTGNVSGAALTINGSGGTLNLGSGRTHTFSGDISLTNGTLDGGSSTLNVNSISTTAWNGTGTNFVPNNSTVIFGAAGAQTISATAPQFTNVTFGGGGAVNKTISNNMSVTGITTILGSGSPKVLLANGTTSSTAVLVLGSAGVAKGSYGGTSSSATNINTTYFATATGIINATADKRFRITGSNTQTAGASQTITITVLTPLGTTDTGYAGSKTLTFSGAGISPNGNNPTINGTNFGSSTTLTFTAGVATCSMTLYKAETATISTISVTDGTIESSGTDQLQVTVSASTMGLYFTTQPVGGLIHQTFATQPVVTVQDAYGNVETGTARNVTISLTNNSSSGILSGTTTVAKNITTGQAVFTDLSINESQAGYTLTANSSSPTSISVVSNGFDYSNPVPTLSSLSVSGACKGSTDLLIHLYGTNFAHFPTVLVNGASQSGTFVTHEDITTTITTAQMATAGTLTIQAVSPTPGGGTTSSVNFTVSQVVINASVTQPSCSANGSITLAPSGGVAPYTYDWSDLSGTNNTKDRIDLAPGSSRTVTVTDANGCSTTSETFTMTTPTCVGINVCKSETAAVFSTTPDPANTSYTWTVPTGASITSGQGTPSITVNLTGVAVGTHQVTVTASNVCGTSTQTLQDIYVHQPTVSAYADLACSGGSLNLYAFGGVSYSWTGPNSFVSTNQFPVIYNAGASQTGTYTVTITDADGCTAQTTVNVTVNTAPTVTASITNATAAGDDGAINITASGGTSYTYLWNDGITDEDRTGLTSGTYTVTVTSNTGCTVTKSFLVNDAAAPTVVLTSSTNVNCNGGNNGAINITVSATTGTVTYLWTKTGDSNFSAATEDLTGLTAGTYNVIVSDDNGSRGLSVTITEPSSPVQISNVTKTNVNCYGGGTGAIDITVAGGTGTYTYAWTASGSGVVPSGQSALQDLTGLVAGSYQVVIKDKSGGAGFCELIQSYTITQAAAALSATKTITNVKCKNDATGQIILSVSGGTSPYTYAWTTSGGTIPSGQSGYKDLTGLTAGTYNLTITDAKGCTFVLNNNVVGEPTNALTLTSAGVTTAISCNGGSATVTIAATGGTGTISYTFNGITNTNGVFTGVLAGNSLPYSIVDGNGCSLSGTINVTQPTALSLTSASVTTPISCNGGTATVTLAATGGTGTISYTFNGVTNTNGVFSGISAGTNIPYSITDANNCGPIIGNLTVTQPDAILVDAAVTNVVCHGSSTGIINITATGGTGSYTYDWYDIEGTSNAEDRSLLAAGTYTVKVTDGNGCFVEKTYIVSQSSALTLSMVNNNISCHSSNNGSITLLVSGGLAPYTYAWTKTGDGSFDIHTKDLSGLSGGIYNVTVTDANNCTATLSSAAIVDPAELTINVAKDNDVTCYGGTNGAATVTPSGGTSPFNYLWSNGATIANPSNLAAGSYSVVVTDANGCSKTGSVTIGQAAQIELFATTTSASSCGGSTGSIDLTVENGVAPFTYNWSNSLPNTQDPTGLAAGTYNVTVIDNTGCSATLNGITVGTATALSVSMTTIPSSCLFSNGTVYAVVTGGVAPYSYSWTKNGSAFGGNTSSITGLDPATYAVTVTDANTCTANNSAAVTATICNPPVAVNDLYNSLVGQPVKGDVSLNDHDADNTNSELEFLPKTLPNSEQGVLVWDADFNGKFTFNPTPGFSGTVVIRYMVEDPLGLQSEATLTINVYPTPVNDINTTFKNKPVAGNVLTNDLYENNVPLAVTSETKSTTHGTVTINPDGTYIYTPATDYVGTDTFTYQVCNTDNFCATATVNIEVLPLPVPGGNNPPVATPDTYSMFGNNTLHGNVISNDFDIDGNLNPTSITLVSGGSADANGTIVLNANGTFTYVPDANFNGQVSFTYQVCDSGSPALCSTTTVTIDVMAETLSNFTFATDDVYLTNEDVSVTANVLDNDFDPEGNTRTLNNTPVVSPQHGTVTLNSNGTFTYKPHANFSGTDQFVYKICDNGSPSACDNATVYLNVIPANDPPLAINDINTTFVNTPVTGNVLTNDKDPEGDVLTVSTQSNAATTAGGTVTVNAYGTYTYTPKAGFVGEDTFTYQVCDTYSSCSTATVTIQVLSPAGIGNNPPVANDDAYQGSENVTVSGNVISNDFDVDGNLNMTSVTLVGSAPNTLTEGTLTLNANGTFTFVPVNGFKGNVSFTYQVCDNGSPALCDQAVAVIKIQNQFVNTVVAVNDAQITNINVAKVGNVLTNDFDPDGNTMTVQSTGVHPTTHGSINIAANGTYTYTPFTDYVGDDTYTYQVCDNGIPQACDNATLTITVMPAPTVGNDPPVAVNDAFIGAINTTVTGNVISNDYDVDGNLNSSSVTLTSATPNPATQGTLTLNSNGTFSFVPVSGYTGTVTFTYQVCDMGPLCDEATVTIEILSGNSTFAVDDAYIGKVGTTIAGNLKSNDYDPQGDTQTVTAQTGVSTLHGTVTVNTDGTFIYTPNGGYVGTDQFIYQICDNGTPQACQSATVYLNVVSINYPPVAINDVNTTFVNTAVSGQVLTNDSDPEGGTLTVATTPVSGPSHGNLVLNSYGTYTYTPTNGYVGEDSFTYSVCDNASQPQCTQATVTIEVMPPANYSGNPPVAVNDAYQALINYNVSGNILNNDFDFDGNTLTVNSVTFAGDADGLLNDPLTLGAATSVYGVNTDGVKVVAGTLNQNSNGIFSFVPTNGFTGLVTYNYIVSDGNGGTDNATVTINVVETYKANSTYALNDAVKTDLNTAVLGNVLSNDFDPENNTLTLKAGYIGTYPTTHGSITLTSNGSYTYTPENNYTGDDTFTYEMCDNGSPQACSTATLTITVMPAPTGVNDAPVAINDVYHGVMNSNISGTVITNDYDVDNDPLTLTAAVVDTDGDGNSNNALTLGVSTPVYGKNSDNSTVIAGSLTLNANGTFTYVPTTGFTGTVNYNYTISDGNGGTDTAGVTLYVTGGNSTFAADDAYFAKAGTTISGNLKLNDYDPQGDSQTVTIQTAVSTLHGTVTVNADGTFIYTPTLGYTGTDQFVYQICDNGTPGACDMATVYLNIVSVNIPPVAINDVNTTFINKPVSGQVLTNDRDPEGGTLTVSTTAVSGPAHGNLVLNAIGTYTYTPASGYTGEDSFTYSVCDNAAQPQCSQAVVTIDVMPAPVAGGPNAPVAVDDAYQAFKNSTVNGNVIGNDFDYDGNTLTVTSATVAVGSDGIVNDALTLGSSTPIYGINSLGATVLAGSLTLNTTGVFSFVPTNGFVGKVTYDYVISDGHSGTDNATVTINVVDTYSLNSTYAINDAASTYYNTVLNGNVLSNDYDPDNNTMTVSNTGTTALGNGTIQMNANGSYTFTPGTTTAGDYTFAYTMCDNGVPQACSDAVLTITVIATPTGGNDAPVAVNDAYHGLINTNITGTVTSNDLDPDNDSFTVVSAQIAAAVDGVVNDPLTLDVATSVYGLNSLGATVLAGTLNLHSNGTFTFIPETGFTGKVTYNYTISDGSLTDTAVVTLYVTGGNSTFATDDAYIGNAGVAITGNVKTNDYDPESNSQTVNTTAVTLPTHGTLSLQTNGSFSYTPTAGFYGTDTFVYKTCDTANPSACDNATVYLNVYSSTKSCLISNKNVTPRIIR